MEEFVGLRASRNLSSDLVLTLDAYLAPLFGCLSPVLWGFWVPRFDATLIFSLGQAVKGRRENQPEALDMLVPQETFSSVESDPISPIPEVENKSVLEGLRWYVRGLSAVLDRVFDLAAHTDVNGVVDPVLVLQHVLTLEQVLRCMASQVASIDRHVQRSLMFQALDSLQGLQRGPDFDEMLKPKRARRTLMELEDCDAGASEGPLAPSCAFGSRGT